MACINSDGSLTLVARDVLETLDRPRAIEEIRDIARQPVYRVRASLREMAELGLVVKTDDHYSITEAGRTKLAGEPA
jgi:predicted transcriptional regulator